MKSRFTISRMTSRGVKCSPAVSLESSANLRMSSSKTAPIWALLTALGVEVDVGELLRDEVEQLGLGEAVDLGVELEALEDVAHGGRERLDVGAEVFADVVLVAHELLQVERRGVVEELAGFPQEERLGVQPGLLALGQLGEHGGLGGLQHAIETAKDGERQNDLAVFGLLVVAAQEIGDGPDEGGKIRVGHVEWFLRNESESVGYFRGPAESIVVETPILLVRKPGCNKPAIPTSSAPWD